MHSIAQLCVPSCVPARRIHWKGEVIAETPPRTIGTTFFRPYDRYAATPKTAQSWMALDRSTRSVATTGTAFGDVSPAASALTGCTRLRGRWVSWRGPVKETPEDAHNVQSKVQPKAQKQRLRTRLFPMVPFEPKDFQNR